MQSKYSKKLTSTISIYVVLILAVIGVCGYLFYIGLQIENENRWYKQENRAIKEMLPLLGKITKARKDVSKVISSGIVSEDYGDADSVYETLSRLSLKHGTDFVIAKSKVVNELGKTNLDITVKFTGSDSACMNTFRSLMIIGEVESLKAFEVKPYDQKVMLVATVSVKLKGGH